MEHLFTPQIVFIAVIVVIAVYKANIFITKDDLDKKLEKYMSKELCTSQHKPIEDMKRKIDEIYNYLIEKKEG